MAWLGRRVVHALQRLRCAVLGHKPWAPALEHGSSIPPEFIPASGDSHELAVAKFKAYTDIRCRRCGVLRAGVRFTKDHAHEQSRPARPG